MKKVLFILLFVFSAYFSAEAQLNINHYIRVGRTRISIGNYTGAIEYFNIVLKFRPHLPEAYFFRGVAKHQLEDFRGAINDYNKAIEIKPFYPQAYMNRGMAYHNLHMFEKAIEDYDRGLEFDPDDEAIYNNRGIAKLAMQDVDGAIADYDKALEINPKSTNALMNRSNARIVQGNVEDAIRDLNQVITIRPHFAGAYLNRGIARFEMDDFASALRDYDQSIKLEPENSMAYNNRGIVKHKLEDYEGAIADYDLALRLNPEMASAYFNRAMAREILGREGFENDYQIAAQLNPQFDLNQRRLDAEKLAQNQQSGQGQPGQPPSATPGTSQQSNTQQSAAGRDDDDDEEEEATNDDSESTQRSRRSRINLIVEDTRELPGEEEDPDDGLVQNRNIAIDLQPLFVVSAFEKNSVDYERFQYYSIAVDELNELNNYNPFLTITNKTMSEYQEIFENFVLYFNARLEINESSHNYLNRAIFHCLTGDYNSALNDLKLSVSMNENQPIAYFVRGNCRYNMLEQIELLAGTHQDVTVPLQDQNTENISEEQIAMPEYQKIIDDYNKVLSLNGKFFFGYYNRAFIKLRLREYKSAMEDLNKAIELEPEFAEAYFNRGLTKIYLDDIEGGALDLSRAGELGIHGAYKIIKRYCN
ncbi:MAG: tetratricopeptide repeat protein [Prolixibacteraceae bacterium]|nr:tetratricopeptide repeat protein [Prolixibacteraceae bacterium]